MAKLYFSYAAMNAGKSTVLLQASWNYQERGMRTLLFTSALYAKADVEVNTSDKNEAQSFAALLAAITQPQAAPTAAS